VSTLEPTATAMPDEPDPMKIVQGTLTLSAQMLRQAEECEQALDDIESGRREWNPDKVDWEALEEFYEDA
jgi:hypothetical protein